MNKEIGQSEVSNFNFSIAESILVEAGIKPENLPKDKVYGQYIVAAQAANISEDKLKSMIEERKNQNWQNRN